MITHGESLWFASRSKEGAWRVMDDDADDGDLLNPRTGTYDDSIEVGDLYSGSAITQGLKNHYHGYKMRQQYYLYIN